jgi:heat shock protein HslJ
MRQQPGDELMVTLEGQMMDRPSAEGGRPVPTLVVNRYISFWPGETCGGVGATSPLQETYWKLTRLRGKPIILKQNQREPSLVYHSAGNRVTGFAGCKELTGSYSVKGSDLTFGGVAVTLRGCIDGMDTESILVAALKAVLSWRIGGEHLELYDTVGRQSGDLRRVRCHRYVMACNKL